jgi:hypothetical protein
MLRAHAGRARAGDTVIGASKHANPAEADSFPYAWAAVLAAAHLALCVHFLPPSLVFGAEPIQGDDYDLHIGQTWRVIEGLDGWGKSWVYDAKQFAGKPAGVISDAGNKAWELWTFALWKLGLPKGTAFNTFVLFAFVLAPIVPWVAARLFGLNRRAALWAATLASALWYFDSFAHWLWWVGMVSWSIAGIAWLLPLVLFWRFLAEGCAWQAFACGLGLGAVLLVHPYAFFALAPPMAVVYARAFRHLAPGRHAVVAAIAVAPLAINGWWLLVDIAHWHYIEDSGYYAQTDPSYLVADLLNLVVNPTDTGVIGTRTGFRFLVLGLAAVALWRWRRERDARLPPVLAGLGVLLALAYLGAWIPGARQIQPYRNVFPATMLALLPAAWLLERAWRERWFRPLEAPAKAMLGIGALVAAQHLAGDVLYFFPSRMPTMPLLFDGVPAPISNYGFPDPPEYRLPHSTKIQPGTDEVVAWIERHVPSGERVLVDGIMLGERLAWKSDVEVMGGFTLLNVTHAHANFFRGYGGGPVDAGELRRYLETYGIGWVVLTYVRPEIERRTDVLERVAVVAGRRVYRTTFPVTRFLRGKGRVRAGTNRVAVMGSASEDDVVVAYHWHEKLVCRPDCRVAREPHPLDRVGFVRVPAPHPASFVVENGY